MDNSSFTIDELNQTPLIDQVQWARLVKELSLEELIVFTDEYVADLKKTWLEADSTPFQLEEEIPRSLAHRFAGTAGTIGLKKIRHAFLCIEYAADLNTAKQFFEHLETIVEETDAWVKSNASNK